jgi:hypothetical protein
MNLPNLNNLVPKRLPKPEFTRLDNLRIARNLFLITVLPFCGYLYGRQTSKSEIFEYKFPNTVQDYLAIAEVNKDEYTTDDGRVKKVLNISWNDKITIKPHTLTISDDTLIDPKYVEFFNSLVNTVNANARIENFPQLVNEQNIGGSGNSDLEGSFTSISSKTVKLKLLFKVQADFATISKGMRDLTFKDEKEITKLAKISLNEHGEHTLIGSIAK